MLFIHFIEAYLNKFAWLKSCVVSMSISDFREDKLRARSFGTIPE